MQRHKLHLDDLDVASFPTTTSDDTGYLAPLPVNGPLREMKPNPTDYFASCTGCTFVGLVCC